MSSTAKNFKYYFWEPCFWGDFCLLRRAGGNKRRLESRFSGCGARRRHFCGSAQRQSDFDRRRTEQVGFKGIVKTDAFYDRSIDAVILTHPHLDHYAGFNEVLKKYKVSLEMDPGTKNKGAGFYEFENLIKNKI